MSRNGHGYATACRPDKVASQNCPHKSPLRRIRAAPAPGRPQPALPILNAETKINNKEYELFCEIREKIGTVIHRIQKTSAAISSLDVLASFAEVSNKLGYVRPVVNDGDKIQIEKGRHPVIEQTVKNGIFVSNDTYIDRTEAQMLLITGPNMSGKSTYMRQTAIIVLMAQSGCFVPQKSIPNLIH